MNEDDDATTRGQQPGISFLGQFEPGMEGEALVINGGGAGAGGLPPPMPGSGGWITAENVGEFFDEDGNWKGSEGGGEEGGLGEGAGRVRERDEEEPGEGDGEETKWTRTG